MCMKTEQDIAAMAEDKAFDELTAKQSIIEVGSIWRHRDYQNKVLVINAESKIECRHPDGEDISIMPRDMFLKVYTLHAPAPVKDKTIKAHTICQSAIDTMVERGKTYDKDDKQEERSMGKTVAAFNALTGHSLTEEQGWLFMVTLKMARAQQGYYKDDNYLDGTAYFALAGEAASVERKANDKLP